MSLHERGARGKPAHKGKVLRPKKVPRKLRVPARNKLGQFKRPVRRANFWRVEIAVSTLAKVKASGIGPSPETVTAAQRRALRVLLKRMAKVDRAAAVEAYFTLGLVRAISRTMTGKKWEKQDAFIGATDYLTAYRSEWPAVMAGPNKVKQYRAAVLKVRVDGFFARAVK